MILGKLYLRHSAQLRSFFGSFVMPPKGRKRAAAKAKDVAETVDNGKDTEVVDHKDAKRAKKEDDAPEVVVNEKDKKAAGKGKKGKKVEAEPASSEDATPQEPDDERLYTPDFTPDATTKDGKKWDLKISSWNVNGIRAWLDKDGMAYLKTESPDIFCVQETKCEKEKIPAACELEGYHTYWLSGDKEGYSGVGLYSKVKPIDVTYGINEEKHDKEGRVITAEYDKFFMVTAYVPNSGRGLPRLPYRSKEWDVSFRNYLKSLDARKPVIMCGDLNVAHLDIDLKNPKTNKKTAGFTQEERDGFTDMLNEGFVDSFRHLYPTKEGAYTFWTFMMNARGKDVGWRLDYFVISERLTQNLCDNIIRKKVMGSDHCPIVLLMALQG